MDTRASSREDDICTEAGLTTTLESFKGPRYPSIKDVLRHFYFQLRKMRKKDVNEACIKTTESLMETLSLSYLPLMTFSNIKSKIKKTLR